MRCSIARALDVAGESWTLLIVRDLFRGSHRFDELRRSLGVATNVLAARLARLTNEGIVERTTPTDLDARPEYHLTEKGRRLGPVLLALSQWGEEYQPGPSGAIAAVHDSCGHSLRSSTICPHCNTTVSAPEMRFRPALQRERHPRRKSGKTQA